MAEKLINISGVLLFGRIVEDVAIVSTTTQITNVVTNLQTPAPTTPPTPVTAADPDVPRKNVNKLLQNEIESAEAKLARIYGFAYEGHYYDLSKPALFLVHGAGTKLTPAAGHKDLATTSLVATSLEFASDVKVWSYDKSDLSIRMDVETGTFDQILLEVELSADRIKIQYAGQKARLRGGGPGNED